MEKKSSETVDVDLLLWQISANDDEKSFRQLFEYYYPALCLYARRFIEEKEIREDIVQDIFFSIWGNRKQMNVQLSARSYLTACVRNHCLNYVRHRNIEACDTLVQEKIPLYAEDNDEAYTLTELQDLLTNTLRKLPPEYRQVFELNRFEDKSYGEIAAEMNISIRTVERYKNKAIEILRKELKDFLPLLGGIF